MDAESKEKSHSMPGTAGGRQPSKDGLRVLARIIARSSTEKNHHRQQENDAEFKLSQEGGTEGG